MSEISAPPPPSPRGEIKNVLLTQEEISQVRVGERADVHVDADARRLHHELAPVDGFVAEAGVDFRHDAADGGVGDGVDGGPGQGAAGGGDAEGEGRADHVVVEHVVDQREEA